MSEEIIIGPNACHACGGEYGEHSADCRLAKPKQIYAPTDTDRLEWVIRHTATVVHGDRMKTRRGGVKRDNLERVWQVEWEAPNGDLIMQSPDNGHKTFRDAIDAAMGEPCPKD